jgi:hypothetical protein
VQVSIQITLIYLVSGVLLVISGAIISGNRVETISTLGVIIAIGGAWVAITMLRKLTRLLNSDASMNQ